MVAANKILCVLKKNNFELRIGNANLHKTLVLIKKYVKLNGFCP